MKSFEIVPYTGKSIVHCLHIAHHNGTARCCLKEAQQKISKLPANSALLLTDAAKATYNGDRCGDQGIRRKEHAICQSIDGSRGRSMKSVLQTVVSMHNKRDIAPFQTRDEAMNCLAAR